MRFFTRCITCMSVLCVLGAGATVGTNRVLVAAYDTQDNQWKVLLQRQPGRVTTPSFDGLTGDESFMLKIKDDDYLMKRLEKEFNFTFPESWIPNKTIYAKEMGVSSDNETLLIVPTTSLLSPNSEITEQALKQKAKNVDFIWVTPSRLVEEIKSSKGLGKTSGGTTVSLHKDLKTVISNCDPGLEKTKEDLNKFKGKHLKGLESAGTEGGRSPEGDAPRRLEALRGGLSAVIG